MLGIQLWTVLNTVVFGISSQRWKNKHPEEKWIKQEALQVTRIRSTTIMKIHVIAKIASHVKHVVLELSEYIFMARTLARPVLAKLCSTACSVESSICTQHNQVMRLLDHQSTPKTWNRKRWKLFNEIKNSIIIVQGKHSNDVITIRSSQENTMWFKYDPSKRTTPWDE